MGPRSQDSLSRHLAEALKRAVAAESDRRLDMVRAVLADQWAVAVAHFRWDLEMGGRRIIRGFHFSGSATEIAALPCASDVVEELLSLRTRP